MPVSRMEDEALLCERWSLGWAAVDGPGLERWRGGAYSELVECWDEAGEEEGMPW